MSLELVTPPAQEPITLATAKLWARIDGNAFDVMLPGMIAAARQIAEQELGSYLITQTRRLSLEDWPHERMPYSIHPVQSVSLSYWNGSAWANLPAGQAVAVRDKFGVYVRRTVGGVYGNLVATAGPRVRADFIVGYGDNPEDVPHAIRQFIAAHIAFWIRNPEAALIDRTAIKSPFLAGLLDPFRTFL